MGISNNILNIVRGRVFNVAPSPRLSTWKMMEPDDQILYVEAVYGERNMIQQNLTYDAKKILAVLRENRKDHIRIYDEAVEGYGKALKERLGSLVGKLSTIEDKDVIEIDVRSDLTDILDKPRCHKTDYDVVIKMFEMTNQQSIELTSREVAQYLLDRWDWTDQFVQCGLAYSRTAIEKYRRK